MIATIHSGGVVDLILKTSVVQGDTLPPTFEKGLAYTQNFTVGLPQILSTGK